MTSTKISVIIPVYNAEKTIERCVRSLFSQTMDEIEYIFIDDSSPDKSFNILNEIIAEFPQRKNNVKIIIHKENQGVAKARYDGIIAASGEYIIHCDPDDWIETDIYETLYEIAKLNESDIVYCNVILHKNDKQQIVYLKERKTPQDCISGYCKSGGFYFPLWNKIVKRDLIERYKIYPPSGINLGEDVNMMLRQLHFAKNVAFCSKALYHYDISNQESLSHNKLTKSNWEMGKRNTDDNVAFLMAHNPKKYRVTANFLKFTAKMKILRANPNDTRKFFDTYKDCRKDILKFTCEPLRVRLIHFCMLYSYPFLRTYQWLQSRK